VFGVSGSGFRVEDLELRVWLFSRVCDSGLRVSGLGFRVSGLGSRVEG